MSNIKSYDVDYDWKGGITVDIDFDKVSEKYLHEINDFWSGSESRLRNANGDIVKAVLKMLAREAMKIAFINDYNVYGVVCEFSGEERDVEGWPPMDGSEGITLTGVDVSGILEYDDMSVTEVKE